MNKELHSLDVRNQTKEEAVRRLFQAETTYLASRGWTMLCGTQDNKYYVLPGIEYQAIDAVLYSHEEALKIQKEKDRELEV